jgi:hypothetical protein
MRRSVDRGAGCLVAHHRVDSSAALLTKSRLDVRSLRSESHSRLQVAQPYDSLVEPDHELIQIAERQLAEAEEAYRRDPSPKNQRRIVKRWDAVREARGERAGGQDDLPWWPARPGPPLE